MNSTSSPHFDHYVGALSIETAEGGIDALQANATRLARDAKLLLHARRNSSAAMLGVMAIAELSRLPDLLDLATRDDGPSLKSAWRRFRGEGHPFPWVIFQAAAQKVGEDYLNTLIELMKHVGCRVECAIPGAWLSPDDLISRPLAEALVNTAEMLCAQQIDLRAARLWIQVVRSLPKTVSTKRTLEAYRAALVSAGMNLEAGTVEALLKSPNAMRSV